ncbi:diguanylate cyclase [Thalassomonas actiniarum]|uniref:diguanylate cyclase n=1 Tax=Thalassomonas actiniarum TaxID=485447 RepID=A0AAF0C2Y4_9GAMM|nr:diguanylate cyclase [Thalassomonas actiniarum]WDD99022.1 diguanylate cyclase [Thalassomonas actiniarum]
MILRWLLCLGCLLLCAFTVTASDVGQVQAKPELREYRFWQGSLADAPTTLSPGALAELAWQKASLGNKLLPLTSGVNWLAFSLVNDTSVAQGYYLTLANSFALSAADLYVQYQNSAPAPAPFALSADHQRSGKIMLAPQSRISLYLVITSARDVSLPLELVAEQQYQQAHQSMVFIQGLALGTIAGLTCVLLLIFITCGKNNALLLFGYFLCQLLLLSVLQGRNLAYYFPDMAILTGTELPVLTLLSAILLLSFGQRLFELKEHEPVLAKALKILLLCLSVCLLPALLLPGPINLGITLVLYALVSLLLLVVALYLRQKKQRLATLFALVVAVPLIFSLISLVGLADYSQGILAGNGALYRSAAWLHAGLIVLLLSRQLYNKLEDTRALQQEALDNARTSQQAQDELLALQEENQEQLEVRVQERTLELNIALQELESANRELAKKNTIDELSGLYNRRHYDQKMLAEYRRSKRNLTPLSIVVIDIDHFKKVNDNFGHLAGDQCIVWVANHIKQSLKRSSDIGCRYGGEEFCLILPDTEPLGAYALAETLRLAIAERPMVFENKEIPLTVSCGISTYQQQADVLPEQIFAAADKALYNAKDSGRNQVQQQVYIDPLISPESSHE